MSGRGNGSRHVPGAPRVSVIIGARDAAGLLTPTLRSVLDQAGPSLEVLVVDDGSQDGGAREVCDIAAVDPRVRLFRQARAGLTPALRHGCSEARGEYLARIDAGDRMLPGRLAAQVGAMDDDDRVAVVATRTLDTGPAGESLQVAVAPSAEGCVDLTARYRSGHGSDLTGVAHPSVMFRRSVHDEVGGYRSAFALAQDVDLWARMARRGRILRLERTLTCTRIGLASLSARHHRVQLALRDVAASCAGLQPGSAGEAVLLARARRLSHAALATRGGGDGAAAHFVASCLARRGEWVTAEHYYRLAVRRDPGCWRALLGLARLQAQRLLRGGAAARESGA